MAKQIGWGIIVEEKDLILEEQLNKKTKEIKINAKFGKCWIIIHVVALIIIIILYYTNVFLILEINIWDIIVYYFCVILSLLFNYFIWVPGMKKQIKELENIINQDIKKV